MEIKEIVEKLQKSSEYFSDVTNRIKRDVEIYSGNFWTNDVVNEFDRKGRICQTFSQYPKFTNAICSPFNKSPYHVDIEDVSGVFSDIQNAFDEIENKHNFKHAINSALKNAVITGYGYLVLSITDNEIVPESINDVTTVAIDPNCIDDTCSDAEYGAIISHISFNKAKRLYGQEVANRKGETGFDGMGSQWSIPEDSIPCVTFYQMDEDGYCHFYKYVGNLLIDEKSLEPIKRIPIYRITYNEIVRNGKRAFNGIVDMTTDLMIAQNIAFSTLIERANRSPKASYMMEASQLDGLDEYYQKLQTKESLVCLYNGEKVSTPPVPIQESYQTQDLNATIEATSNLMSQVIGVPIGGIQPANQTATEILVQQNNSESNVESVYESATQVIRELSTTILELLCWQVNLDVPTFKLINGPQIITQRMKQRQELGVIGNLLTDEKSRKIIAKHYIETLDADVRDGLQADLIANASDIQFLSDKQDAPPAEAVATMNRMAAMLEESEKQIEDMTAQLSELSNENAQLTLQLMNMKQQNELELMKLQNDFTLNQAKLRMEAAEKDVKLNVEQTDASLDAQKKILDIEKQKLELAKESVEPVEVQYDV